MCPSARPQRKEAAPQSDLGGGVNPAGSLAALALLAAFAAAAWGWGRMTLGGCGLEARGAPAYLAVLGLAALAAIGGWLNLLGLAYAPVLWLLLAAGWVAA